MRLTAAIPLDRQESVLLLPKLFDSLKAHGFEDVLLLWTGRGKRVTPDGSLRVVQAHPDFAVEAALYESTADWVFLLYPGEELSPLPVAGTTEPGPTFQSARGLGCLKEELDLPWARDKSWVALGEQVRGFRRHGIRNGGLHRVELEVVGEAAMPAPQPIAWPEPSLDVTVVLPTWRPGGFDMTLEHLSKQKGVSFEVIIVDGFHRWRLVPTRYDFPIRHLPPDNDVFPLSSHSRFRNTAIRRAVGKRIVFLSEFACPPPGFLAAHAELPPDVVGIGPWARVTINPPALACPTGMSVLELVELMFPDDVHGEPRVFRRGVSPFGEVISRFPVRPEENFRLGTLEHLGHWKSDSAPTEMVRRINGWDEAFDGQGDCADTDFTLRLLWAGARVVVLEPQYEVPVLDAHVIAVAPLTDKTRSNPARLLDTKARRMVRCVHGLTKGLVYE